MQIDTKLDYDLVAVESEEQVHVLLELTAPTPDSAAERAPAALQVVLDRSGSMGDGRLLAALQSIHSLLGRLRPTDRFGLVVFDEEVAVPVPAGPVGDADAARAILPHIHPGGMTDLAGGYLRGIQELQRAGDGDAGTLVLLSDGHANTGVTDHGRLEQFASGARGAGITSSTIGIGAGYDEDLLAAISRGGSGNHHFAATGDEGGAALGSEVEGLMDESVQAVSLTVRPAEEVAAVRLFNDLPVATLSDGFMVELGSLRAAEQRRLILEADVPAIGELGLATVCELELRWVEVETMRSQVLKLPVSVNVVPGDEAAGRTEDATARTELAFQRAQRSKREGADALGDGDSDRAAALYRSASAALGSVELDGAPTSLAEELAQERSLLEELAEQASYDSPSARKRAVADHHRKARKRGRE